MQSADQQKRLRAKREAIEVMEQVAAANATITYSQLAARITAVLYAPNGSPFSELFCDISRATNSKRELLLSAVVVHQDDGLPGVGFFKMARGVGRQVDAEEAFHQLALREVHEAYGAAG